MMKDKKIEEKNGYGAYFSRNLRIGDIANFSMVEIITLQILMKQEPIKRYTLYQEVNDFLQLRELLKTEEEVSVLKDSSSNSEQMFANSLKYKKKNLSTGSFWTNLDKLEKKKFIKFNKNKKGKVASVETTKNTKLVVNFLEQYFLLNVINDAEIVFKIFGSGKIFDKIEDFHYDGTGSILSVVTRDVRLSEAIKIYFKYFKDIYILTKNEIRERMVKMDLHDTIFSDMQGGMIMAPDNFFDCSIIQGYTKNLNFFGLSRHKLLKELVRVTKPGEKIGVFVRSILPKTENSFVNGLIESYNSSIRYNGRAFTKEELADDFTEVGLIKLQIFDVEGILVGIGIVS